MKIISLNVNGIRSSHQKGLFSWLQQQKADVVCLQEIKAEAAQLPAEVLSPQGYFSCLNSAEKKGYSGVAIYSRVQPDRIETRLGWNHADTEGRYLQADFGKLSVVSLYLPSGSSGEERQQVKFDFMERFMPKLKQMRKKRREFIVCGDWNIAHKQIDLKNWRGNQKNSGFLPEERQWMDSVLEQAGFVDAFRVLNQQSDEYTWWSNRGQAWAKNVGWRIDYQIVTPGLKDRIRRAWIYREQRFSDHAPVIIEYDI
jgi:exodeoxyribonuclease-3